MKECNQCKKQLPATREYFYGCKKNKNGLYSICKECKKENIKKHSLKPEVNEKKAEYAKEYRQQNKEKKAQYLREYRKKNKEKITESKKLYYQKNKEKISDNYKVYRQKNKETILEKDKIYRENNKDKRKLQEQKYLQTEHGRNVRYNGQLRYVAIKENLKFEPINRTEILKRDNWTCQICKIKVHDNHTGNWNTPDKAHLDHIIPRKKGGSHTADNIQVLCRTCNTLKGDKTGKEVKKIEEIRIRNN